MDDSMKDDKVSKHYLVDAVEAALKGEAPKEQTSPAMGCPIQFERRSAAGQ